MFCSNCGKEIADQAVVCIHCGVATGNPVNQAPAPNPSYTGPKKFPVVALVGLVLAVSVIVLGCLFLVLTPLLTDLPALTLMFTFFILAASVAALVLSIIGVVGRKRTTAKGIPIAAMIVSSIVFAYVGYISFIVTLILITI